MTHAHTRSTQVRARRVVIGALAVSAALTVGVSTASAQVEVPTRAGVAASSAAPGATAPAPAAVASPVAPATTPAATTAPARTTVALTLRLGSRGNAVKDLQRALRKRGMKITVDGAFGARTRVAVRAVQKRFKLRATGVADTKLLKKLGLRTRTVASATAPVAAPGASQYLSVFPVLGDYSYFDDFGAGRHQGSHEGNDIMADKGTPAVAVADARVNRLTRTERGLGGIYVWLERADGTEYYYAHLASIATGLEEGHKVTAGQVIGTVGNTGDARYGAHHLHFEIRVGGTTPIDPYKHLVAVDGTRKGSASRTR